MAKTADPISLNSQQKEAIKYTAGPLLIIAGAGTGKTTILVDKIKSIIHRNLAKPEEILALTFTEKAAREMETRVDEAMPYGLFQMWISTFHSFADQILRIEASHIGLSRNYKLMTEAESILFVRKNFFLFKLKYFRPLGNPHKFLADLLRHFSRLKDEDIGPTEYERWVRSFARQKKMIKDEHEKYEELAHAYRRYEDLKAKAGVLDFSDLVSSILKLFRLRPHLLSRYQKCFSYILVDEFQDTNIAQYALIKLLCPSTTNPHLTVVGDDSQAIYKFRGASVSNIMTFMKDYPRAKQITIRRNYRSPQTILDASYRLIKMNDPDTLEAKLGISKSLVSERKGTTDDTVFQHFQTGDQEADYVAAEIKKLARQYRYSDCTILVRANNSATPFTHALTRLGIPYQFFGPSALFKQPEVKDLIAYLKTLYNVEDSVSLYRVLSMELFEIDQRDINLLMAFTKKTNLPLFQAVEICLSFFYKDYQKEEYHIYDKFRPLLSQKTRESLLFIYKLLLKHLAYTRKETAGQVLFRFLEESTYLRKMSSFKSEREEKVTINISEFFGRLKSYELEHEDASVRAVVDYIDMCLELGESPLTTKLDLPNVNTVNIMTVHSAKGLEFPVVFLVNLSRGRFPTYERKEVIPIPDELIKEILPQGDYHLEEERRLFYVGLTRAIDRIYLTSSLFYGDGKRERSISPFVPETIGEKNVAKVLLTKKEEKSQLTIFDFKTEETVLPQSSTFPVKILSFSQLSAFNTCPLQYKYQYILKIPTAPSSAASFGNSIHKALQAFYQEYLNNQAVSMAKLLTLFDSLWVPLGYASLAHEKRMKKEGREMLSHYYKTFHRRSLRIVALEKLFKIRLDQDMFIAGKIDRVDQKTNGEIEIIDYKTGRKPVEKELKKSLQLSIYALAATDHGLFNKTLSQVTLSFYYFQDMEKISMKRTPAEMAEMKKSVYDSFEKIRSSRFPAKVGRWCDFCSFKMICEAWQ
ncbi:ATP-dependent helicase [Candidatus Roizmanbacteria bacterium]|nr:ATP-dependent helicase [Candidatus Roizmanbacteria bacterium]